jgi:hypothetical protein
MNHINLEANAASAEPSGKSQNSIKVLAGRKGQMARAHIRREILAVLMESPFYFTIPLRKRLEFLNSFSQQSIYHRICQYEELRISGKSDGEGAVFDKTMNPNDPKDPIAGPIRAPSFPKISSQ